MDLLAAGHRLLSLDPDDPSAPVLAALIERSAPEQRQLIANALRAVKTRRRAIHDPGGIRREVFAALGYEPNCAPRIAAARALGYRWPADAVGVELPPLCGQCPQERFHEATEYDVFYGGAAGGGKTRGLLMEAIAKAVTFPGMVAGVFRETYPELRRSFLRELTRLSFCRALGATWNVSTHELSFPTGSVVMFANAQTEKDATNYQSTEFQLLIIDELTKMLPGVVDILKERVRSSIDTVPVSGMRSGSNPGNVGHGPVKARYVEATDHGERVVTDDQGRGVRFIPSKATDNPHLDAGYLATLDAIPDPARRAAMRDGSWDVFAGMVFDTWRYDRHTVDPFTVPMAWERLVGIDYGYAAPWSVHWAAVDPDGRVWIYREIYEKGVGQTDQARAIIAAETDDPEARARAADPSMWAKIGEANPIATVYANEGCFIRKANNNRLSGIARVHQFLADGPACTLHREMGWETCPRLHVFRNCTELIRELPALPRDPKRPEDVDTHTSDHAYDSIRYLLMEVGAHGPTVITNPARSRIPISGSSAAGVVRSPFGGR